MDVKEVLQVLFKSANRVKQVKAELMLIGLGAILTFLIAAYIDTAEALFPLLARYESYELDELIIVFIYLAVALSVFSVIRWREIRTAYKNLEAKNQELQRALNEVKELRGILPICASCKKVRDDSGYWQQVESYVSNHSRLRFSHGFCPECASKLYPASSES